MKGRVDLEGGGGGPGDVLGQTDGPNAKGHVSENVKLPWG